MITAERAETLRRRLQALGFDEVRFAGAEAGDPAPLLAWLERGMHADMAWLERTAAKRLDPRLVLPGVRSVVMLGVNYLPPADAAAPAGSAPIWARYALYEDYHDTMKPALVAAGRALEELLGAGPADYRYYVDTGPVLERGRAERAGIGFLGKNGMLISPQHGNWLFLAAILIRLELPPDAPLRGAGQARSTGSRVGLLCGKCTRCIDACPTQAIPQPGVVDARRCISYQTIENKGVIPRELRAGIGNHLYGCDVCLEVCPWNRFARAGRQMLLAGRSDLAALSLAEILALTPARFAEVFRRTAVKRLKLAGLLRNACVVAGNSGDPDLLPALVRLAAHASETVRAQAVAAVFSLAGEREGGVLLQAVRARETAAVVRAEYPPDPPM